MQTVSNAEPQWDIFKKIPVGIPVFDNENRKVGDVDHVQFALSPEDGKPLGIRQAPEEFQQFLMQEGYIQINTGFLWPEHFATPHQVAVIKSDGLYLNVPRYELLVL